jgi:hypothetical protein
MIKVLKNSNVLAKQKAAIEYEPLFVAVKNLNIALLINLKLYYQKTEATNETF